MDFSHTEIAIAILTTVLAVAVPLIGGEIRKYYRSLFKETQRRTITEYAKQAVQFAEQAGVGELAVTKKMLRYDWLTEALAGAGIKVNVSILGGRFESAVYTEFNKTT